MPLLGHGALAMWWEVTREQRAEFEHWHTHEHYPERLGIPGFRRGSRWLDAAGGEGVFQIYEVEQHGTLSSPAYLARLNAPTPWSTRMMPLHRHMVRTQCHVIASHGLGLARHALTVRLSPRPDRANALRTHLTAHLPAWAAQPGVAGAHLLRHETPAIALTAEQKIRGGADGTADWVLLVHGYALDALQALREGEAGAAALAAQGAEPGAIEGLFTLSVSATPADVAAAQEAQP